MDEPTAAPPHVLVVDSDALVAEVVTRYLQREGFFVECTGDGEEALHRARHRAPDLIVLDLALPGLGGLEVLRRLRELGPCPVVLLVARGGGSERVLALDLGADDYVTKPFSPRELTARATSVLRRSRAARAAPGAEPAASELVVGDVVVDLRASELRRDGRAVALTVREFDLLAFLVRHPGRTFGREELLEQVWGWASGDASTVTLHVRRLRDKIGEDPARPSRIVTVWGVGYRFQP